MVVGCMPDNFIHMITCGLFRVSMFSPQEARRAAGPQVTDSSMNAAVHGGRLDRPLHSTADPGFTPPEFQRGFASTSSRGSLRGSKTDQVMLLR